MELILRKSEWRCKHCEMLLTAAEDLCCHVVSKSHRTTLRQVSPNLLREQGRLWCFLDTYLHEEPILGLEYVKEQRVGSANLYTCLLCNAKEDWRGMFFHIVDVKHVERYIDKRRPLQAPRPEDFADRRAYIDSLIAVASKVLLSVRHKDSVNRKSLLRRKKIVSSRTGAEHPRRRNSEIMEYLHKFSDWNHFCILCGVTCSTTLGLYEHVMGVVHEANQARLAPKRMKEFTGLRNFLDTYMNGEPILGLGFIEGKERNNMYEYNCLLCHTQENWPNILTHLLTVDHVGRYIERYDPLLAHKPESFGSREDFASAVITSAIRTYKKLGDASLPHTTCEDDDEAENPSPLDSNTVQKEQPCSVQEMQLNFPEANSDEITQELEVLGVSSVQKHFCTLCQLFFPNAVELCKHLLMTRHKVKLEDAPVEVSQRLSSLKYYLATLLKNEPFVGLEYIVQIERRSSVRVSIVYDCLLCSDRLGALKMLFHICSTRHIKQYIKENHRGERMFPLGVPNWTFRIYTSQICKMYGRKEIQLEQQDMCDPAESKVDGLPSNNGKNDSAAPLKKIVTDVISGTIENQTHKIEVEIVHRGPTCDIGEPASAEKDDDEKNGPTFVSEETELDAIQDE